MTRHSKERVCALVGEGKALPSSAEMAEFDSRAIAAGVSSMTLMERAGKAVARELLRVRDERAQSDHFLILCGPGNNGGDGLVLARELRARGYVVKTVLAEGKRYTEECLAQLRAFLATGGEVAFLGAGKPPVEGLEPVAERDIVALFSQSDVVVDALLGTGQSDAPRGVVGELVRLLHTSVSGTTFLCALDVPSGVNAATGQVYDPAVHADLTVAIQALKRGMVQYPARTNCGATVIIDIGISCDPPPECSLIENSRLRLPARDPDSHKGMYGRTLVIGGSAAMPGAPRLTAHAALRSGAGLVSLATFGETSSEAWSELLLVPCPACRGSLESSALGTLQSALAESDTVLLGPGLGTTDETKRCFSTLLELIATSSLPCVIDADGLTMLSEMAAPPTLFSSVLTPHPGEMARLLQKTTAEVQADRYAAAKLLAERYRTTVVLKGASTVVWSGSHGFVNTTGNPFMATAGAGDVLTGVIGALLAQGLAPREAAIFGVAIHARAGDLAHAKSGGPIIASDIIAALASAFSEFLPAGSTVSA